MQLATRLSSTDIIGRFMTDSPARVQQAMRTTVVGLMGNMDKFAIDAGEEGMGARTREKVAAEAEAKATTLG